MIGYWEWEGLVLAHWQTRAVSASNSGIQSSEKERVD